MIQSEIKRLLEEAANLECSLKKRTEIQRLLEDEIVKGEEQTNGIKSVFNNLYVETIENRPELLPTLFPAFAVMCSERDDGMVITTRIDWELMTTN